MDLTVEQRIKVVKWFYMASTGRTENGAVLIVQDNFRRSYDRAPPNRTGILKIIKKFETSGEVTNQYKNAERPKTVLNIENCAEVHNYLIDEPSTSQRQLAREFGFSKGSVNAIIKKIGLKCYIPRLIHSLNEDDPDRRMQFCETFQALLAEEQNPNDLLDRILWTDEAKFHLNGRINRHNCVYYASENPHITIERDFNTPGINVWIGIWSGGIIGPYFIEENITGDVYLNLLQEKVMPAIQNLCPVDTIFQQDGASPHFARQVRDFLDEVFPECWIGRRGPVEWPARSCDLTPPDFSVWGSARDLVYLDGPKADIPTLKEYIEEVFRTIFTPDLCTKICRSVAQRVQLCIDHNGGQFEHFK